MSRVGVSHGYSPDVDASTKADTLRTLESFLQVTEKEKPTTSQVPPEDAADESDNCVLDASVTAARSEVQPMFLWTWADVGLWSKSMVDQSWSRPLNPDELAKDLKMHEESAPERPLYIQAPLDPVLGREFKSPTEALEWLSIFSAIEEAPKRSAEEPGIASRDCKREAKKMIWRWKDVGFLWKKAVDRNPIHWSCRLSPDELEEELKMYEVQHPQRPLYIQQGSLEREFESPKEAIKYLYVNGGNLTAGPALRRAQSFRGSGSNLPAAPALRRTQSVPIRSESNKANVEEDVMIVLLQHGSHGHVSDFENVKRCILEEEQTLSAERKVMKIECWSTTSTEGFNTDSGLETCGEVLAKEFEEFLREMKAKYPSAQLHLSCIGHSYGGLISRYALAVLDNTDALRGIKLHAFVTLASPHVGAHLVNMVFRLGARGLGALASTAYQELMLDNHRLDKLCEATSLAPLKRFARRVLYTCTRKDPLVKPESGGLVILQNGVDASIDLLPAPVPGHPNVREALRLEPYTSNSLRASFDEGTEWRELKMYTGERSGLKEMVKLKDKVYAFKGADNIDGVRANRAAFMLGQLREVGDWCLHFVHFSDHIVRNAHGAIICHPGRIKNGSLGTIAGEDVARHVAKLLFEPISNE